MADKWEWITAELDSPARGGDPAAIRDELAKRGRREKTEAAVWIDHSAHMPGAEAVTSGLSTRVYLRGPILAELRDPPERIEVWHNHPYANGEPGSAVPSAEDIGAAVMPGMAALTTVDDNGRWTRIWRGENAEYHPLVVTQWVQNVRKLAELAVTMNNPPPVDEEQEHRRAQKAAEVAAGAAVAIGLIKAEGLSAEALKEGMVAARLVNADKNKTLEGITAKTDVSRKELDGLRSARTPHQNTRRGRWTRSGRGEEGR